ncbi:MAG: tetratricopeptide repeat protein [Candidatus Wallbacteria bacterium]|nr:tetratricopeptide repeat protein [Candidatus Wallbacteria bacterium]
MRPSSTDFPRFVTFYSYKGGVGRTMALSNVACQLANRHGKHVICIDWDLEAPGLHYYFGFTDQELAGRAGLLDYLLDFEWQVRQQSRGQIPEIRNYLLDLKPEQQQRIRFGSVRLMHCGRTDRNYMARVQDFDWEKFYTDYEGSRIVEVLKKQLVTEAGADMVLIDTRAGQAEVGLTPMKELPDVVVLLFTSNDQSLEGTERIARELKTSRGEGETKLAGPTLLLVPSRVFPREESLQRWLDAHAVPVFDRLLEEGIVSRQHQPQGFYQVMIPVDPKWSIGERLPMLEAPTTPGDQRTPELSLAYAALAQALDNMQAGKSAWQKEEAERNVPSATQEESELRSRIEAAVRRGDEASVATAQWSLSELLWEHGRLPEAEAVIQTAQTYAERAGVGWLQSNCLVTLGRIRQEQIRSEEAWELLERSLVLCEQAKYVRGQCATLTDMGRVRREQGRLDEAWELFERALALGEQSKDVRLQGVTLTAMGRVRQGQGRLDEAWELFERSLALGEQSKDVREQGVTLTAMGRVRQEQGRLEEAWELFERSLALSEQSQDVRGQCVTLRDLGRVRQEQGRLEEAWDLFERSLALDEQAQNLRGQGVTLTDLGRVRMAQGQVEQASAWFQRALEVSAKAGNLAGVFLTHLRQALLSLLRGQVEEALAAETQAAELSSKPECSRLEPVRLIVQALVRLAQGREEDASSLVDRALSLRQDLQTRYANRTLLVDLAYLRLPVPKPTAAEAVLTGAAEKATALGDVAIATGLRAVAKGLLASS